MGNVGGSTTHSVISVGTKSLLGVTGEEDIVMSTRLPSDVTSAGRGEMTNEIVYASHTNVCGSTYLQSGTNAI
jgi:hypothetical protein